MQLITYILADDEPIYREVIQQHMCGAAGVQCLHVCENAIQVNQWLQEVQPDFLILDIDMPGLSGLSLAKSLIKKPYLIFVSSHSNFALEAFDVDAIDFIKKPITQDRLLRAVEKVRNLIQVKEKLSGQLAITSNDDTSFFIREDNAFVRINYDDVLYIESLTDFVKIHLEDGTEKLALVNLKNIEQQLPSSHFIRISRSYIVQIKKVSAVSKVTVQLGDIQLPIGAAYYEKIVDVIVGDSSIKRHA